MRTIVIANRHDGIGRDRSRTTLAAAIHRIVDRTMYDVDLRRDAQGSRRRSESRRIGRIVTASVDIVHMQATRALV